MGSCLMLRKTCVYILLSAMGTVFSMPDGPEAPDGSETPDSPEMPDGPDNVFGDGSRLADGWWWMDPDDPDEHAPGIHPMMEIQRNHSQIAIAKARADNWTLDGFRPGDKVMLIESPSVYRADRAAFFRGTPATVIGPSPGGHPEKMGIHLHRSQFIDETDRFGLSRTREIPNVTVCPFQVCHERDWNALITGKFPRFSVATVKTETYFPERETSLEAGERVIVLNEHAIPSNSKAGAKPSLYIRRCGTETGAGLNYDNGCFERVPANSLELIPRRKKHAICVNCGVQKLKRKMKVCDRCRGSCYCGQACQRVHWTVQHKYQCPKSKASKPARGKAEL